MIGDGKCDFACLSEGCNYDAGDCKDCAENCSRGMLGNGVCDDECDTELCRYDGGDCDSSESDQIFADEVILIIVSTCSVCGLSVLILGLFVIYKSKRRGSARIEVIPVDYSDDQIT
jgi:hypothetical protein